MLQLVDIPYKTQLSGPLNAFCDKRVFGFCLLPYPGHPKGCPNYGKVFNRISPCPPNTKYYPDFFDLRVYAGILILDFAAYLKMMSVRHPVWTDRQLKNVLYWQKHYRKLLSDFMLQKSSDFPDYEIINSPETMGVNVFATLVKAGFKPEVKPTKTIHLVSFFSSKLKC
jgi:hypothetical protein